MFRIALERPARLREVDASSATRSSSSSTAIGRHARPAGTRRMWIAHVVAFFAFLVILPITMLRHMFTSPLNMYLRDRERPKGAMKPMPNLTETVARDVRRVGRRGLHVEAAARHRRLHDVRPLHQRVPGPRHRQAARPPRDRAQDRRGHGRDRQPQGLSRRRSASTTRSRSSANSRVRADHRRGDLGVHQSARRATRSARSTSRSSTRSSTCAATCR